MQTNNILTNILNQNIVTFIFKLKAAIRIRKLLIILYK